MSATISHLPGAKGPAKDPPEAEASGVPLPIVPDRVLRIIDLYRRISEQSDDVRRGAGVTSILRALNEGRDQDAFDLLNIVLEGPDPEVCEALGEVDDGHGTPIPEVAQVWRHLPSSVRAALSRPHLTVVDEETTSDARVKILRPARTMAVDGDAWMVSAGDLEVDILSRRASLDLGFRGEVFLLLRSGRASLTIEGDTVAEIACCDAEPRLARIVFCGRSDAPSIELRLEATGQTPLDGIWFLSTRINQASKSDDLLHTTFLCELFRPIGAATPTAFCEGAAPLPTSKHYRHRKAIKRGDFRRFGLAAERVSVQAEPVLNISGLATTTAGVMAAAARSSDAKPSDRRELDEHDDAVEIIIAIDGITWVAVAPGKASGPGEERPPLKVPTARQAKGSHQPVFVTPLAETIDGGCDVMLLRPTFGHSVWMTPGSQSRFLHLMLDDPAKIQLLLTPKPADKAEPDALRRGAGRG